jgi:hypothetical protein
MGTKSFPTVPINLPSELVAKMETLKQDREADRDQSVEQIVQRLCRDYVKVREMDRSDAVAMDQIERSYVERPSDWDDQALWQEDAKSEDSK